MAIMYVPGGRRSAAPVVSPRAALTSAAISDDQVTRDLLSAMQGYGVSTPAPVASGSPVASTNLADIFGSGTATIDWGGGESAGPGQGATQSAGGNIGFGQLGAAAQGLSALGILSNDLGMVQGAQTLGTVAAVGAAGQQAAQGNLGAAAMTLAPMAAQAMGIPGAIVGPAMTAMNPTLGPVDMQASLLGAALSLASPPLAAVNSLATLFGLPTLKGMLTPVEEAQGMTPGESAVAAANTMAAEQNIDPMDALMAVTDAFGTAPGGVSSSDTSGIDASMGVGIDGVTVG